MAHDVLIGVKFLATSGGEKYHIKLDLVPSGAFHYGNGHALIYTVYAEDGKMLSENCFDARYDNRFADGSSFLNHAREFVKGQLRSDFTVEPEDDFFNVIA